MSPPPPSPRVSRRRCVRAAIRAALLSALLGGVPSAPVAAQAATPWPMAGRDAAHTGVVDGPAPPYREAWSVEVGHGGPAAGPAVAEGAVIVVAERGVVALDPRSGEPLWEADRTEGPAGPPAIVGDLVVHVSGSGSATALVARAVDDGVEAWRAFVDANVPGGVVAADGLVYAATTAGEVVAVDAPTGEERWRAELGGRLDATPAVADGLVLAAGTEPSTGVITVFAVDAAGGGDPEWRFSTPGGAAPASAPASSGGRAFVATSDGTVRALDLDAGTEAWEGDLRAVVDDRQIPAAADPLVVADRLHLYARDLADGKERWRFLLADLRSLPGGRRNTLSPASPAVIGGVAVIGDTSGVLSAVDVATGRRVWRLDLGPGPLGPVAADGDLVYATTMGGSVTALEHDPGGVLLDEPSPTTVFPLRAVLNFALAAAGVGLVAFGLSWLALRGTREAE